MARGKRTRVATGVYQDAFGYAVVAKYRGVQKERRFPAATPRFELTAGRAALLKTLKLSAKPEGPTGTLAADIRAYLKTIPKGPRRQNAEILLEHWRKLYGQLSRPAITALMIREQLAKWSAAGGAASTINHRRQELLNLYNVLDGRGAPNPVRDVPRLKERYDEPRAIPAEAVEMILSRIGHGANFMRRTEAIYRLRVMLHTGLPQAQLARLTRRDVDFHARTMYVRARQKGEGATGRTLPLTTDAVKAFRDFDREKLWGDFSRDGMSDTFNRAVEMAELDWRKAHRTPFPVPSKVRPYDLRHTFLTNVFRQTRNIKAVKELGLHASLETSERYVEAAVSEVAARAVAELESAIRTVPSTGKNRGKNTGNSRKKSGRGSGGQHGQK